MSRLVCVESMRCREHSSKKEMARRVVTERYATATTFRHQLTEFYQVDKELAVSMFTHVLARKRPINMGISKNDQTTWLTHRGHRSPAPQRHRQRHAFKVENRKRSAELSRPIWLASLRSTRHKSTVMQPSCFPFFIACPHEKDSADASRLHPDIRHQPFDICSLYTLYTFSNSVSWQEVSAGHIPLCCVGVLRPSPLVVHPSLAAME